LFSQPANEQSMSGTIGDSYITLTSGQVELKIRYKELCRALFSPLIASWPTFFLMREVARTDGGWATLAVTAVGFATAIVGFGARSFRARRADHVAFKFVATIATVTTFYSGATAGNRMGALIVGGMMVAVGMIAARFVTDNGLAEFERETLQAIRRGDLKVTREYFDKNEAPRIRIVDPLLRRNVDSC
jgi:hypothetical protein